MVTARDAFVISSRVVTAHTCTRQQGSQASNGVPHQNGGPTHHLLYEGQEELAGGGEEMGGGEYLGLVGDGWDEYLLALRVTRHG